MRSCNPIRRKEQAAGTGPPLGKTSWKRRRLSRDLQHEIQRGPNGLSKVLFQNINKENDDDRQHREHQ
jgi:hypothetical protein